MYAVLDRQRFQTELFDLSFVWCQFRLALSGWVPLSCFACVCTRLLVLCRRHCCSALRPCRKSNLCLPFPFPLVEAAPGSSCALRASLSVKKKMRPVVSSENQEIDSRQSVAVSLLRRITAKCSWDWFCCETASHASPLTPPTTTTCT